MSQSTADASPAGSHVIIVAPAGRYRLTLGSLAVGAGGLLATSGCPRFDQRGESRPWGPACDIGAFELHYRAPGR